MWTIVPLSCLWTAVLLVILYAVWRRRKRLRLQGIAILADEMEETRTVVGSGQEPTSPPEYHVASSPINLPAPSPPAPPIKASPSLTPVFTGLFAVAAIFALDLGVLWSLNKIGGAGLQADVHATISKLGGNIAVAAAGLLGCFLAVAIVGFGGVYLMIRVMKT